MHGDNAFFFMSICFRIHGNNASLFMGIMPLFHGICLPFLMVLPSCPFINWSPIPADVVSLSMQILLPNPGRQISACKYFPLICTGIAFHPCTHCLPIPADTVSQSLHILSTNLRRYCLFIPENIASESLEILPPSPCRYACHPPLNP